MCVSIKKAMRHGRCMAGCDRKIFQGLQCARTLFGIVWCCQNRAYGHNQSLRVPSSNAKDKGALHSTSFQKACCLPKTYNQIEALGEHDGTPEDIWVVERDPEPRVHGQSMLPELPSLKAGGLLCILQCTVAKCQSQRRFWRSLGRCSFSNWSWFSNQWD